MELWALEAYGVSYAIQEMITIKSDAVRSRYKAAESIVNGESLYRNVDKPSTLNILEKILASGGILMQLDYEKNTYERDVASYVNRKIMEKKSSEEEDLVSQLNLTMLG
jgi:DNA-directed RNA polymerase subunit beta